MFKALIEKLKNDKANWAEFQNMLVETEIPPRTILLQEGAVADHVYFIRSGCLRLWFNKDGKDITVQFFLEGQAVASIDSFMEKQPSLYTLESIEPCTILSISRETFVQLSGIYPELKEEFYRMIFRRFRNYAQLFLSRIKDTPRERYAELIARHPEIIRRVPQHYIASYLGITPISLSRIRNRK